MAASMATAVVQLTLQIEHLLLAGREREGGKRGVGGRTHWTWQDDGFGTRFDSVKCKIFSQRFACSHKDSEEGGEGLPGGESWGAAAGAALSWRRT